MMGFGWMRDFFRMPLYVREANGDKVEADIIRVQVAAGQLPGFSFARFVAQWVFASTFGGLLSCVLPPGLNAFAYAPLRGLGAAVGVWLVAILGPQTVPFRPVALFAVAGALWDTFLPFFPVSACVLGGIAAAWTNRAWRGDQPPRWQARAGTCKRLLAWWAALCALGMVVTVGFYQHATVIGTEGEPIRVADYLHNLRHSPFWQEFDFAEFAENIKSGKFSEGWEDVIKNVDLEGEAHSYVKPLLNKY
jgi:hypothetical protein